MIDRLIAALDGLDPQPTAEELADALWLAERLSGQGTAMDEAGQAGVPVPDSGARERISVPDAPVVPPPNDVGVPETRPPADVPVGLFVPARGSAMAGLTRSPAVPALPRTLPLARALRPLRRNAPSRTGEELDEEATAELVADTRIWEPVIRPAAERWLDLALVVDDSASMVIWQRTSMELRTLLERVGAFRDIRLWRFDTDADPLVLHAEGGSRRSTDELIDPTMRRVVLVVSDCIGRAWGTDAVAQILQRWGRAGPVAILQPLPQRLWRRCAAAFQPVALSAAQAGLPNDRLTARPRNGHGIGHGIGDGIGDCLGDGVSHGHASLGVPIPVMEVEPRWIAPWATMVSVGSSGFTGMALFTGRPSVDSSFRSGDVDALPPIEVVMRFRATASPAAFQLAGYLAAAPLRLPVMRLVQRAMLPRSRPAHLAEVFLGDLLRRVGPADAAADPDDVEYDFRAGVRDVLLGSLHRTEALRILRNVWEVIRERMGSPLDFPALLGALERGDKDVELDRPFASVASRVLRRLGGRYCEAADRLAAVGVEREAVPEVGAEPSEDIDTPAPHGSGGIARRPVVWGDVPPRNPNFTGRDDLLRALRERLAGPVTALFPHTPHGLGGVGKTQVAVEYAHRFAAYYDVVWWIPAEQITLARSSLADLARRLGVTLSSDINRTVDNVLEALRADRPYARWLLIYDNAGDPEELKPLIPISSSGHVLITSRDVRWDQHAAALEVNVFERAESIALLRRRLPLISWAEADRLADKLGDLPLAVEQAAAWQAETGCSADEYVSLLEHQLDRLRGEDLPDDYPPALAATWALAFERLREEEPAAGQLLELCAFFGPEPISLRLLSMGQYADLPPPLRDAVSDQEVLDRAVRHISRYSLAHVDRTHSSIQLHRLVQAVLRSRLTDEEQAAAQRLVHAVLAAANPDTSPGDETTWDRRSAIAPHVVPSGVIDGEGREVRRVALDQIRYLYVLGDYEGSRLLGEMVLERWRDTYGPDDEQTLAVGSHLANTLRSLGQIMEAAALNADTLERTRRRFGADHELTLTAANSVGADLRLRGDFRGARLLDEDTFRRTRRVFGEDDTRTLRWANNLGVDLRLMGDFHAALVLDREVRERLERQLGPRHRDTILVAIQVARDLHGLGNYRAALKIQTESLKLFREILGNDHRFVLEAALSYSVTLRKDGQHMAARRIAEDTLRLYVRRFGDDHPDTLAARGNLAGHLVATGDPTGGKAMAQLALAGYQHVLGADHPFTYAAMAHLGIALRVLDEPAAARKRDQDALAGLRRLLGKDHYYALCGAVGLFNDLYLLGEYDAAYELSRDTLERSRRVRGPEHHYTLACAHNHALILRKLGEPHAAGSLRQEILPIFRRTLGDAHPDTTAMIAGRNIECDIQHTPP